VVGGVVGWLPSILPLVYTEPTERLQREADYFSQRSPALEHLKRDILEYPLFCFESPQQRTAAKTIIRRIELRAPSSNIRQFLFLIRLPVFLLPPKKQTITTQQPLSKFSGHRQRKSV